MSKEHEAIIEIKDKARIAVYDNLLSAPRVVDIPPQGVHEFIEAITVAVYELSHQQGGMLPYTVIREITENFIHAGFLECTVSILDEGNTLRFADQGPGITKKELVLKPGVSSATTQAKEYIRGVGSGFPIVKEYLSTSQGYMSIEDNAEDGVVVTISLALNAGENLLVSDGSSSTTASSVTTDASVLPSSVVIAPSAKPPLKAAPETVFKAPYTQDYEEFSSYSPGKSEQKELSGNQNVPHLTAREEQALLFLNEHGMLGPVDLAAFLAVSAPTAFRLLQKLEQVGMVESTHLKKRILSNAGMAYIQELLL